MKRRALLLLGLLAAIVLIPLGTLAAPQQDVQEAPPPQTRVTDGHCYDNPCYYYLAQWEWVTSEGLTPFWRCPDKDCIGLLDLRSIPAQGLAGTAQGFGFFVYASPKSICAVGCDFRGVLLANAYTKQVDTTRKTYLEDSLKLTRDTIAAGTPVDMLWDLLTLHADVTGEARWKPLMPTVNLVMELRLGGHSIVRSEQFDQDIHPLVLELEKTSYRQIREESLQSKLGDGDRGFHRRWLQAQTEKYRLSAESFIPPDLPIESPLPHRTTLGDTFVEGSDTALESHTATGPNGGFSWTKGFVGSTGVTVVGATDLADNDEFGGAYRAESDLSSSDHYSQAEASNSNGSADVGVVCRYSSSVNTFYNGTLRPSAFNTYQIWKIITGTPTSLDNPGGFSNPGTGVILNYFEVNGSTLTFESPKGTQRNQITDTSITTGLRGGISYQNTASTVMTWDDWEMADLAAPPRRILVIYSAVFEQEPWLEEYWPLEEAA